MRTVRTAEYLNVLCLDEPGAGNACHKYEIVLAENRNQIAGVVNFQNGPIQESGVNGIQNEDLLAIVIDRLQGFQSGQYACERNEKALTSCLDALKNLEERTAERKARNVEGKNII